MLCRMVATHEVSKAAALVPPPRPVPLSLQGWALFGGIFAQISWGVLCFGLTFLWIFFPFRHIPWLIHAVGRTETVQGKVLYSEETNASMNERSVYVIGYAYTVPEYGEYEGESFRVGSGMAEGGTITIEYAARKPSISRIKGLSRSVFGLWGSVLIILPAVGALMVVHRLRKGRLTIRLLARGNCVEATFKSKKRTGESVGTKSIWKLTFSYTADGEKQLKHRYDTHKIDELTDGAKKRLLYDPVRPAQAVLFDPIPGNPSISEAGQIQSPGAAAVLTRLLLPLLTVLGHGVYAYVRFIA